MISMEMLLMTFNTLLLGIVGFLISHEVHDIKTRIVRLENLFLPSKGGNHVD
jgi:hypothetical protein